MKITNFRLMDEFHPELCCSHSNYEPHALSIASKQWWMRYGWMTRTRMAGWGDGWCSGSWDNALPLSEPQWDTQLKDFGSLGVLGCGEVCGRRDMELRTSVFSARSDFVAHFPRFYLTLPYHVVSSFLVNALEWMLKRNITVALTSNFPAMGQRDWHNVWNSCVW